MSSFVQIIVAASITRMPVMECHNAHLHLMRVFVVSVFDGYNNSIKGVQRNC